MYGKIFDSMYEGTLYGNWEAIVTFQQMIVLCDADGIVDMTPQAMAARTSIPLDIIRKGIAVLEAPDEYSRTPDQEGRRIELIDSHRPWGWHIVNHEKYSRLQDADTIRAQTRERVRKHRESKRSGNDEQHDVTDGNAQKRHTDTNTNTDTDTKKRKGARSALPPLNPRPDWLPAAWDDYESHRKGPKWTELARQKAVEQLEAWHRSGYDLRAIINTSIANGWTGLFAKPEHMPRSSVNPAIEAFVRGGSDARN